MALTPGQVAGIASQGTPAGTTVEQWVAKSRQENAPRDPAADNGTAVGIWQVNYRVHTQWARDWLKDPWNNWQATREIYAAQGWQAWAASGGKPTVTEADRQAVREWDPTYAKPGAYDPGYVFTDPVGAAGSILGAAVDPIEQLAGVIRDGVEVVIAAGQWIADPHNIARVGMVAAGGVIVVMALAAVAAPAALDKTPVGEATKGMTK